VIWLAAAWNYSGQTRHNPRSASLRPLSLRLVSAPTNPLEGGQPFVLSGSGFTPQRAMRVTVNGQPAKKIDVASTSTITAIAPPSKEGVAVIEVVRYDGSQARLDGGFRYSPHLPSITKSNPEGGPMAGGSEITITGSNFEPGAEVWFGITMSPKVTIISRQELRAVVPASKYPGAADLVVYNSNGESSNEADFDYE
jgi:hypothetical protein